jgi:hypothetical protein
MQVKTSTIKYAGLLLAASMLVAVGPTPAAFAQAPAPSSASGPSNSGITDPGTVLGNHSGGTAPGPVYSGPAAAAGANSPPVNSGVTDPKTGANNDTLPSSQPGLPSETSGMQPNSQGPASH